MATIPAQENSGDDHRSAGGKITRSRRNPSASKTPYSRPAKSPAVEEEDSGNPNWISNLIYPVKFIVSGAGKLISLFRNDCSSSSEDDSENDDDEMYEVGNYGSNQVFSPASKSNSKLKIDQLVMEESFSREEGEQLIRLIKSRIVDTNVNSGEDSPLAKKMAIIEARNWLQEKRTGSKKNLEGEFDFTSSQFTRKDQGSPVDVAKSYMQNRPTWLSTSSNQSEFESPSTLGMLHFKEETPASTLRSSELKTGSFADGSWNLVDEIRRVRTKATEDLLATTPLMKNNLSMFPPAYNKHILEIQGDVEGTGPVGSTHGRPDHVLNDAVANSFVKDNQDGNGVPSVEHKEHAEAVALDDVKDVEVNELRSTMPENGFAASGDIPEQNTVNELTPLEEENGERDVHVENSIILTDHNQSTTITGIFGNGSQNNLSMQEGDVSEDLGHPTAYVPSVEGTNTQKERKSRSYIRRGRSRGK